MDLWLVTLVRLAFWLVGLSVAGLGLLYVLRFFDLANAGTLTPMPLRRPTIAEAAAAVGAFAREWLAALALLLIRPLGWGRRWRRHGPAPRDGRRPVVLVNGYLMNRSCFTVLGRRLLRDAAPVYTFNMATTREIRSLASDLAYFVEDVAHWTGAKTVDVVGYSLGGLVARYYVERLGGAARVQRVVTVGTPHRGTRLAVLGVGRSAEDMLPGSFLLSDLQAAGTAEGVEYTSITSSFDPFILPRESAWLPPPARNVELSGLGHAGLLLSPRVARAVQGALSDPERAAGGARAPARPSGAGEAAA